MSASITQTLGLNLTSFVLYGLAFLVTVGVLAKFVWPPLTKILDAKVDELESAARLEAEATAALKQAEDEAKTVLAKAEIEADEVVARAKTNAQSMVSEAEDMARSEAARIAGEGQLQLENELRQARQSLRQETIKLVTSASEHLLGEKLDSSADQTLVERAIERSEVTGS